MVKPGYVFHKTTFNYVFLELRPDKPSFSILVDEVDVPHLLLQQGLFRQCMDNYPKVSGRYLKLV